MRPLSIDGWIRLGQLEGRLAVLEIDGERIPIRIAKAETTMLRPELIGPPCAYVERPRLRFDLTVEAIKE